MDKLKYVMYVMYVYICTYIHTYHTFLRDVFIRINSKESPKRGVSCHAQREVVSVAHNWGRFYSNDCAMPTDAEGAPEAVLS